MITLIKGDLWNWNTTVTHKLLILIFEELVRICLSVLKRLSPNEQSHELMVLFVLRKLIFQMHMCSHPVGLDVWFLVGPFIYFHTSCVRTAKALVRLGGCAGSPEPSLVAYVISTIMSWAGSNLLICPPSWFRLGLSYVKLSCKGHIQMRFLILVQKNYFRYLPSTRIRK